VFIRNLLMADKHAEHRDRLDTEDRKKRGGMVKFILLVVVIIAMFYLVRQYMVG